MASRTPQSLEARRHLPWHSAINNDAARPRSDRKVSAGAFGKSGDLSIRGMPKFSNWERMLGFGSPGDMGTYIRGHPQTNPTLGQVFHTRPPWPSPA